MEAKYFVGIDPATEESKGAICILKRNGEDIEWIKSYSFYEKWNWWNRLKFKWECWKLYWRYYRGNVTIVKETNQSHNYTYFKQNNP